MNQKLKEIVSTYHPVIFIVVVFFVVALLFFAPSVRASVPEMVARLPVIFSGNCDHEGRRVPCFIHGDSTATYVVIVQKDVMGYTPVSIYLIGNGELLLLWTNERLII